MTHRSIYPSLSKDITADVVIIGAGIAGITTAYLLAKAGKKVVVIGRHAVASGETANTTAMITHFTDTFAHKFISQSGEQTAKNYFDTKQEAMNFIARTVKEEQIECDFIHCHSYIYALDQQGFNDLQKETQIANKFDYHYTITQENHLLFPNKGYVTIPAQAKFKVKPYVQALAQKIVSLGGEVYENTVATATKEDENGAIVQTEQGTIQAHDVVIATNYPFNADVLLLGKLTPYNSYVVSAEIPTNIFEEANYWDTNDPYYYFRIEKGENNDLITLGGCDHRTGKKDYEQNPYDLLERYLKEILRVKDYKITYRWSGQVLETADGIPYIGKYKDHQYIATGFWGNGMTFGTYSGMLISDILLGQENNTYVEYFNPTRLVNASHVIKEHAEATKEFMHGYAEGLTSGDIDSLPKGEGMVMREGIKPTAVFKNNEGEVCKFSAVCTHLHCIVNWNSQDKTWDCPCHGSRFSTKGEVITGPAIKNLE